MRKIYTNYIRNFEGLSKEIWLLSFVTFINRAGAMVIPFLSLYLVSEKGFSLPQVGIIMTCYGVGSMIGTIIGGKLTDVIGYHKVIVLSLLLGGLGFIGLQFFDTFYSFCIGVFALMLLVDSYRPAVFVAAGAYSKPESVTRAIALIRLAINLGFSIGPLIGGLLITKLSYGSLFWIDGTTCVLAGILLFMLLKPKRKTKEEKGEVIIKEGTSPYGNGLYMLLFIIMVLSSITFVQYFSVLPLYYKEAHFLSEDLIGLLMFINGAIIVIFEMPLVGWLERIKISKTMALFWGHIFIALSFIILNVSSWGGVLVIGMVLMTLGEMIGSPFSSALALSMAPKGRKGSYMGLFSMSFSISHVVGHIAGMNAVDQFGFDFNWYLMFGVLVFVSILTLWLYQLLKKSKEYDDY
jgi:predicted MFS family arabinose efflux permease